MKSLFKKVWKLIKSVFGKGEVIKVELKFESPQKEVKIQNEPPKSTKTEDSTLDPAETDVKGPGVTHCLWKPISDTSPELVLAVAADTIRREHLFIKLFDSTGKPLKIKSNKSYSDHRDNQLPDHKLGRFNFKPGLTVEQLKSLEPITVKFYIQIGKKKYDCKVGGLDEFVVKNVKKRWVCTNGKVRLDPK